MRKIKLLIQYDGSAYHGWAAQPEMPTIQGTLTDAIEKLTARRVELFGSSRTDAGVHALGQVAAFTIDSPVPTENFARALNNMLPDDIAVVEAVHVPDSFDPISDTKSKIYRYTIYTGPVRPVIQIRYCWHRPGTLNVEAMQAAAKILLGMHDFKSFASAADNRESSIRTIIKCDVSGKDNEITFDVQADGFLYNMVRNIVGTLVEVGRRRWTAADIERILAAKDRCQAGPIAPASGLCLMRIFY
ncbi:MAG: tRNA pseudouridine(38-40) synthase TruA [Planctomycetes bacterium]|nr:tRNA pseudouridine(38-40) synthase TruA [Planctomycetota bacterium]